MYFCFICPINFINIFTHNNTINTKKEEHFYLHLSMVAEQKVKKLLTPESVFFMEKSLSIHFME